METSERSKENLTVFIGCEYSDIASFFSIMFDAREELSGASTLLPAASFTRSLLSASANCWSNGVMERRRKLLLLLCGINHYPQSFTFILIIFDDRTSFLCAKMAFEHFSERRSSSLWIVKKRSVPLCF